MSSPRITYHRDGYIPLPDLFPPDVLLAFYWMMQSDPQAAGRPWALSVATERTDVPQPIVADDFGDQPYGSVAVQPGGGVLYQGTHHRHGRLTPNPNSWSAHLFLHWVEQNGRYADQAFDRPAQERAAQGR